MEAQAVEERQILEKIPALLLRWYDGCARVLPWREDPAPYRVWVSEIMLQQTRVEAVKPYYERFLERLPTVKAVAEAPEEQLLKLWEGLGYYNRVRNLMEALCAFLRTGDRQEHKKARLYFFIILLFALGAEMGSLAVELLDLPAIWLSCALLALGFWPLSRPA